MIKLLLLGLLLAACTSRPDIQLAIQEPAPNAVITIGQSIQPDAETIPWVHWMPGYVTIRSSRLPPDGNPNCPVPPVKWDFRDNGASYWDLHGEHLITLCQSYDAGSGNAHTKTFSFDWEPLTLGQHVLTMRGAVQLEVSVNGNWTWYDGGSVTVCVRNDPADPVPGVPMGVPGSCNPPPTATSQINAFPTFTLSPVPVRVLPTHTPAPPAPPLPSSGDACSQFTSQDNCNLAGCSWSGSACTVTQ